MLYLFIFWEPSEPSGARMRTNTEVGSALPSAKPSLPRGLLRGEPPNVPKNAKVFRNISVFFVYLEETDARRKQLRYRADRAAGPPTPPGYGISTHHSTPKSIMNAKFYAEVYLSRTREHRSRVKKTKARIHKASMGHTVDFNDNEFHNS